MYKLVSPKPQGLPAKLPESKEIPLTPTVTSQPVFIPGTIYNGAVIDIRVLDESGPDDPNEIAYELGLWLSGIEAFVSRFEQLFTERNNSGPDSKQWLRAMRLARAGLLRCSDLLFRLRTIELNGNISDRIANPEVLSKLSEMLRMSITLNESLVKGGTVRAAEWRTWRKDMIERLSSSTAVSLFQSFARNHNATGIPEPIRKLIQTKNSVVAANPEVCGILREFASILMALGIVGRMLRNDEPLKPTLLIFAFVYEQTQTLIGQINHRLSIMTDEETEAFISLDGASYSASLEIKKAFNQELEGVVGVRPAHLVYAHVEVAHSLLSASFEEIIASFARTFDPAIKVSDIFPSFTTKLEQSLTLRSGLSQTLRAVQEAESTPNDDTIGRMRNTIEFFNHEAFHFLYYKDKETVESLRKRSRTRTGSRTSFRSSSIRSIS